MASAVVEEYGQGRAQHPRLAARLLPPGSAGRRAAPGPPVGGRSGESEGPPRTYPVSQHGRRRRSLTRCPAPHAETRAGTTTPVPNFAGLAVGVVLSRAWRVAEKFDGRTGVLCDWSTTASAPST